MGDAEESKLNICVEKRYCHMAEGRLEIWVNLKCKGYLVTSLSYQLSISELIIRLCMVIQEQLLRQRNFAYRHQPSLQVQTFRCYSSQICQLS